MSDVRRSTLPPFNKFLCSSHSLSRAMRRDVKPNFQGNSTPPTLTCADSSLGLSFAKQCVMRHIPKERTCASSRNPPPIEI